MPFRSLNLNVNLFKAVQEAGYLEPTPIQAAAIPEILAQHDLIGIAQTGTGKTAAFVLPILSKLAEKIDEPKITRALVLAPTRELVVQIDEAARVYAKHLPLRVASVYGGVGEKSQIQALRSGFELIIATPGRLLDLMSQRAGDFSQLEYLVLDEADRMLDMGFLPAIRRLIRLLPTKRQTLLFSATLSKEIEGLSKEFLRQPKLIEIGRRSNPAESVTQFIYEISHQLKSSLLLHLLRDAEFNTVLVFTRTKHGADRLAERLKRENISVATLHANRSQGQRQTALKDFKSGAVRVLVATDIASRGIDVDGISHVINYDFPKHPEDYIHRIGRTGRAQAVGDAISFITFEDYGGLHAVERFMGRGIVRKRAEGFEYPSGSSTSSSEGKSQPAPARPVNRSSRRPRRSHFSSGRSFRG